MKTIKLTNRSIGALLAMILCVASPLLPAQQPGSDLVAAGEPESQVAPAVNPEADQLPADADGTRQDNNPEADDAALQSTQGPGPAGEVEATDSTTESMQSGSSLNPDAAAAAGTVEEAPESEQRAGESSAADTAAYPTEESQPEGLVQKDGEGSAAEENVAAGPGIPLQRKLTMKREISLVVSCDGAGVCRERETGQPLRVLPKSFSHVYRSKDASSDNIAVENVAAYKALYVFARDELDLSNPAQPGGWYQVGYSLDGEPIGWMQARDVLEWKQALIISYRHRGLDDMRRDPVLMFRSLDALREVVESPVRDGMATLLYQKIEKGDIPPSLASKEPERYVDIDQKFYLLPILDFEVTEIDGDEVRYLQLAAAVPRKRGADVLQDSAYREASEIKPEMSQEQAGALKMDIVFVMDMSRSMQPYIDSTRDAIKELVSSMAGDEMRERVRFGLVGYRDDTRKIPALEFTSKNLTPELVDVERFIQLLEQEAKATLVGSIDYAEEVYAGMDTGLGSAWRDDAMRFLFLIGDASAHEEDHEQSTTGKNAAVLNLAARQAGVRILALHLLDPRMTSDHAIASRQYASLSRIEGADQSALVEISTEDRAAFTSAVRESAGVIYKTLDKARQGTLKAPDKAQPGTEVTPVAAVDSGRQAEKTMEKLMDSALIEYLGKEADPPKDIVVWALDRDIGNPILNAMDVRVLLSKNQLSDLIRSIEQVTKALARAEYSHQQFFEALQSVAGQTLKQPDAIEKADKLAQTGLLPGFIRSLPYRSEVLSLSDEMYAAMTAEQRSALESNLRAKLRQYQDINEQVDGWVSLNEEDPDGAKVYPLYLDYLP